MRAGAGLHAFRFRPVQDRQRRLPFQAQLGVRAGAADLSSWTAPGRSRATPIRPAPSYRCRSRRGSGCRWARQPAGPPDRARHRLKVANRLMGEILFLAHRMPFPPDRGDKIRSHHVLQALAQLAPVHVATLPTTRTCRFEAELAALTATAIVLCAGQSRCRWPGCRRCTSAGRSVLTAFDDTRAAR